MSIGLDLPISVNWLETYNYAIKNDLKAIQFSSIPRDTNIRDIINFRNRLDKSIYPVIHGNLTFNLAGSAKGSCDPQYNRKLGNTKSGLLNELDISVMLNTELVVHIGSQPEKDIGIKTIINTVNEVLIMEGANSANYAKLSQIPLVDFQRSRKLLLENSAGKGNFLGNTLDEISIILSGINPNYRDQVNICIDTCHLSDAGQYKLGDPSQVEQFFTDFHQKIGLNKLHVFHLNDSKNPFGSGKDRHEHLARGYIFGYNGISGLSKLINLAGVNRIPMVGEYPNDGNDPLLDVDLVKSLGSFYPKRS